MSESLEELMSEKSESQAAPVESKTGKKSNPKTLIIGSLIMIVLVGGIYMMMKPKSIPVEDQVKIEATSASDSEAGEPTEPNPIDPSLVNGGTPPAAVEQTEPTEPNPIDPDAIKSGIGTKGEHPLVDPAPVPPPAPVAQKVVKSMPTTIKAPGIKSMPAKLEHEENVKEWALRVGEDFVLDKSRHAFTFEGKTYQVGDQVDGYAVKEINQNYIRFEGDELSYNFRFKKGI